MSLVFAITFFLGGGGGVLRHLAVQTDFEFEISGPLVPIQLMPVNVERSNGTPTGTSRLREIERCLPVKGV